MTTKLIRAEGMRDKNPWLCVIGASQSQVPFIQAANDLGYRTVVFDINPSAPGAALADRFYSISTHDIERILAECRHLSKHDTIAGIITYSIYTMPLNAVAKSSEIFGLRSFSMQAVKNTTNKARMKQRMSERQVTTPEWVVACDWDDALSFLMDYRPPIVVKPASGGMGSMGVSRVREEKQLRAAFEAASKASEDGRIILEKFHDGREFSVGGIVSNNNATVLEVSEKFNLGAAQNFIISGFATGRKSETNFKHSIDEIAEPVLQAVKALDINDSFFGADVLLTDQGPLVLEVGLLLDAKIDRLLFFAGIDVYDMRCKVAVGDEFNIPPSDKSKGYALQFMFADRAGRLSIEKRRVLELADIGNARISVEWERQEGDMVNPPKSVADILGWVMVEAADRQQASSYAEKAAKSGLFRVRKGKQNVGGEVS